MLRIGVVSTSDAEFGLVTVAFEDQEDMVSDVLPFVYRGGWGASNEVPQPGDTVVCGFLKNGVSAGVCFGKLYDNDEQPPGEEGQQGTYYEDGSYVYFDEEAGTLNVLAMGGVVLETPESVTLKAKSVTLEAETVTAKAKSVTAEAESVTLKATTVTIEGTTSIKGNVSIDGNLSVSGTVSASNI
ncbi:phage baseplate assembly protein V [Paenibacillus pabuli]|uniref:phage baseplate assembly protein V n=1 Tax=Paenibacillus pabuli TaxID=1472 RepID=UPI001FFF15F2|nr:phage baseplate assembly protein V [Paenibacillus pabuli]UPK45899.1 phage baseplate assembly protein V [Paenibacillus pabuli]